MKIKAKRKKCQLVREMKQYTVLKTRRTEFCTAYHSTVHRKLLLSWRPGKPATGQDMEVYMKHGLASPGAIIDDQAIALRIEAFFIGDLLRSKEQLANEHPVSLSHAVNLGNVPLGDNQRVHGRLRVDVLECDDRFILKHNF